MKAKLLALSLIVAALGVMAKEAKPVWELGRDAIDPALTQGAVQVVDGVVRVDAVNQFSLPNTILADQKNFRLEVEFRLPESGKPGRINLFSNMDTQAESGLSLRYSPPGYNAGILCVNGHVLFDQRRMLAENEFTKVAVEVRNGRVSFFANGALVGIAGPRVKPSSLPLTFGGTYTRQKGESASYLLRNIKLYELAADASPKTTPPVGLTEKLDIYVCIGQSNMAGRAPFSGEDANPIENGYLLNDDDEWEAAKNPLNRHSSIRKDLGMQKMGPAYMFARTMLQQPNARPIGLVVNAKGGTSIRSWGKGTYFYREVLRRTAIAQKQGTLKGIIWHQGETDAKDAKWLDKLKALITDLRADLNAPDLPFVAGQVNNVPLINEQVFRLPAEIPRTAVVSSDGLKAMDRWHFDTPSAKLLGQRYAEKMLDLQP